VKLIETFEHICEVCDKTEMLTARQAHEAGWDYPPFIGVWGVISQRTCGNCPMTKTAWWAVQTGAELTEKHLATIKRIKEETVQ
jgi:hypothetical protein